MRKARWTWNKRIWRYLHTIVNRLAWKFVPTKNVDDPRKNHWLWKLNNWVADHYTLWYVKEVTRKND